MMQKRTFSLLFAVLLTMGGFVGSASAASTTVAKPTTASVEVNGVKTAFAAYEINGENYFKIRDLAYVINGTDKQFSVEWKEQEYAIHLVSSQNYQPQKGDMTPAADKSDKAAVPSEAKVYLNGTPISFTAYEIGGNNYFRLRDVMSTFNVFVDFVEARWTIVIDTQKPYPQESSASKTDLNAEQVSEAVASSVVYVEVYDEEGVPFASGSAFAISNDGVLITNFHVMDGASSAKIMTADKKLYDVAGILAFDALNDLAIIKVNGFTCPAVALSADAVKSGQKVFAIGSPKGLDNTISEGIVSNTARVLSGFALPVIQTTAPISHGSSGGVLLNAKAQAVGVTAAGLDDAQNINFAVPISAVRSLKQGSLLSFAQFEQKAAALLQPPVNVVATAIDDDEIQVQWDAVAGVDGYYVYYADSASGPWDYFDDYDGGQLLLTREDDYSAALYSIGPNCTMYFKVTSVRNGRESQASKVVSATTKDSAAGEDAPVMLEAELNDIPQNANELAMGTAVIGSINNYDDPLDYFRVTAAKSGKVVALLDADSDIDQISLLLTDKDGKALGTSSLYRTVDGEEYQKLEFSVTAGQSYYLAVFAADKNNLYTSYLMMAQME